MTHQTVPLDLLVRVRDALSLAANGLRHCSRWNISDEKSQAILTHVGTIETLLAELTAQIEQQGQGEPVAWIEHHKAGDNVNWDPIDHPYAKATPLYTAPPATPQDSVPAPEHWRQAICDYDAMELEVGGPAIDSQVSLDWIESRALALAQTKE